MPKGIFNPNKKRKEGYTIDFTLDGIKRKGQSLYTKKGAEGMIKKLKKGKKKDPKKFKGLGGWKVRRVF